MEELEGFILKIAPPDLRSAENRVYILNNLDKDEGEWFSVSDDIDLQMYLGFPSFFSSKNNNIENIEIKPIYEEYPLDVRFYEVYNIFEKYLGDNNPIIEPLIHTYVGSCSCFLQGNLADKFKDEFLIPVISEYIHLGKFSRISYKDKKIAKIGKTREFGSQSYLWQVSIYDNGLITSQDWKKYIDKTRKIDNSNNRWTIIKPGHLFLYTPYKTRVRRIQDVNYYLPITKDVLFPSIVELKDEDIQVLAGFFYELNSRYSNMKIPESTSNWCEKNMQDLYEVEHLTYETPKKMIKENDIIHIAQSIANIKGLNELNERMIIDAVTTYRNLIEDVYSKMKINVSITASSKESMILMFHNELIDKQTAKNEDYLTYEEIKEVYHGIDNRGYDINDILQRLRDEGLLLKPREIEEKYKIIDF